VFRGVPVAVLHAPVAAVCGPRVELGSDAHARRLVGRWDSGSEFGASTAAGRESGTARMDGI
jgi:hypothetical protein